MKHTLSVLFLISLITLTLSYPASADIAPPQQPPGFNPEPGNEATQVRMIAETVTIDVLAVDPPQAHFSAVFSMRNLGTRIEDMAVRFPLAASDGWSNLLEIENIEIKVNNQVVAHERVQGPEPIYGFEDKSAPWAEFEVSFPPEEEVMISVAYDLDGTNYELETYTYFSYILSTGAGWKDTIGSGEITLRLPYDANPKNVILDETQDIPQFSGREARWSFSELEPTRGDNLHFMIVKPAIWKQVVIELENTSQNPRDGEAWGFLGKAYKQALFASGKGYPRVDAAAVELYQLSKAAYERAVALDPEDGLWHAGYAELLLDEYYWVSYQDRSYNAELDLGLRELDLAVRLAPEATKVKELIEEYIYMFPDYIVKQSDGSLDFISLTATPTPVTRTGTPIPTRTASPTAQPATATPQTKNNTQPVSPLCGGAVLILVPLFLIFRSRLG
jgi:tetratricopeptide (TPR) repeat protein